MWYLPKNKQIGATKEPRNRPLHRWVCSKNRDRAPNEEKINNSVNGTVKTHCLPGKIQGFNPYHKPYVKGKKKQMNEKVNVKTQL